VVSTGSIHIMQGISYIDIELTIDPVPPRGNFRDFDFLIPYGI